MMSSTSGKRSHTDDPHEKHKKPRYAYKQDPNGSKHRKKNNRNNTDTSTGPSVNDLKSKIRATKRLLEHSKNLPADVRIEKERALKGYQRDLDKAEEKRARNALITKYHFVRFLERKTATQNMKKLQRMKSKLQNGEEGEDTERESIASKAERPLTEKYISLYPTKEKEGKKKNKKGKGDENEKEEEVEMEEDEEEDSGEEKSALGQRLAPIRHASSEKPPLWYAVEQSMKDGTLDLLREGRLGITVTGEKKGLNWEREENHAAIMPAGQKKAKGGRSTMSKELQGGVALNGKKQDNDDIGGDDDGDESDGGFFEK
ncbi:rRNA-processing protein EFG1 [Arthroderma uncinatum]|uniref:rRNA-processing protein EFG1 n=1 Tax=Arthroderma uncinatum TaxID=74035 RepID=UPI00144AE980|nr:rRNA-processing protein EFG1 [Arthroderma uncinatum]KAF3491625.1 rRNA-processing protein EFG1 [Arthroderma uncinatum]